MNNVIYNQFNNNNDTKIREKLEINTIYVQI